MCLISLQGEADRFPVGKHQCGWEWRGSPWEQAGVGQASAGVCAAMTGNIGKPLHWGFFFSQQPLQLLTSFYFSSPSEFTTKPPLQLKASLTCRWSKEKPRQCELWSFSSALPLPRVFPSRGHVTAESGKQAASEHKCTHNNAQEYARTITHSFMHALTHLSMHESKHALRAHNPRYRHHTVA